MQKRLRILPWLALMLLLGGCNLLRVDCCDALYIGAPADPVRFGRSVQISALLQYGRDDQQMTLPLELVITPNRMAVVVFGHIGGAVLSANLTNGRLQQTGSNQLPQGLQGERLLRDLQLALWPLAGLPIDRWQPGISVVEPQPGERLVLEQKQAKIRIRYGDGGPLQAPVTFEHLASGYTWQFTTLHVETLEPPAP